MASMDIAEAITVAETRALDEEFKRLMLLRLQGVSLIPCGACQLLKPLFELYPCGKCKGTAYCSKACQVEHWSVHKRPCKKECRRLQLPGTTTAFGSNAEHPPITLPCMACTKPTNLVDMVMCGSCKSTGYCSHICRHTAWREGHRNECKTHIVESPIKMDTTEPGTSSRVIRSDDPDYVHI